MRRMIMVGVLVAVVVSAVTVAVVAAGRPEPACACTAEPDIRGSAHAAAVRFETLVRAADVSGAWALLTDGARSRYVDRTGFQPVFDRLGKALHEAGADAGPGWVVADDRWGAGRLHEVAVVRSATGPLRLVWPLLVLVPRDHVGDGRIDPEPPKLRLTAKNDGDGVRVGLPDGDLGLTSFVAIDGTGPGLLPRQEHVTEAVDRLTWSPPLQGPVVVIAVEKNATGLRLGAASAHLGGVR